MEIPIKPKKEKPKEENRFNCWYCGQRLPHEGMRCPKCGEAND